MKMKKSLYILLAVLLMAAAGCSREISPGISLAQDEFTVGASGDTLHISVGCNMELRAVVDYGEGESGWILMLPRYLKGSGVLSFFIDEYKGVLSDRTASVVLQAGGETRTISLRQLAKAAVGLSAETLSVPHAGGEYAVTVLANTEWKATVTKGAEWLSLKVHEGPQGEHPLVLEFEEADGLGRYDMRAGAVHVATDELSAELYVYQGYGTVIKGLRWADANVGQPGEFASAPDDAGCMYQYNSRTPYPSTGNVSSEDFRGPAAGAETWAAENDPSPEGWRIPAKDELEGLFDWNKSVKSIAYKTAAESGFSVDGAIVGPTAEAAAAATKDNMNGCIFIPAAGYRHCDNGSLTNVTTAAVQSITRPGQNWDRYMYGLQAGNGGYSWPGYPDGSNNSAHVIRCVSNLPE